MLNDEFREANGSPNKKSSIRPGRQREREAQKAFRALMRKPGEVLWRDRFKHEGYDLNPDRFTGKVYADRLGKGMIRSDLKYADPQLYRYLGQWLCVGNKLTIDLPTLSEQHDREIAAGKKGVEITNALWWREIGRIKRGATPRLSRT